MVLQLSKSVVKAHHAFKKKNKLKSFNLSKYYLVVFGIGLQILQIWMIIEGLIALRTAKGNYPELPPIAETSG